MVKGIGRVGVFLLYNWDWGLQTMNVSTYQRLFGVGQIALAIELVLFGALWSLDRALGRIRILNSPQPLRTAGIILIAVWTCWHLWCVQSISQWWRHGRLCTTGPYGIVKHPIYAGALWLGIPAVALLCNSWIILSQVILSYPILAFLVRREERVMAAVFGEAYTRYAAQTGKLFPRVF